MWKYIFLVAFIVPTAAFATVGGDIYYGGFSANPYGDVYYYKYDNSGRGCPPEVMTMTAHSQDSYVRVSCDQLENDPIESSLRTEALFEDATPLKRIDLSTNGISIETEVVIEPVGSSDISFGSPGKYWAVIKQNGEKVGSLIYEGCDYRLNDIVMFDGLYSSEFPNDLLIVSSSIAQCYEYGYVNQSVGRISGVNITDTRALSEVEPPEWMTEGGFSLEDPSPREREGSILLTEVTGISEFKELGIEVKDHLGESGESREERGVSNSAQTAVYAILIFILGMFVGRKILQ